MPTKRGEYGKVGQYRIGGTFFEEFLPELRGKKGIEVYREMSDNDEMVYAIMFAIEMLMRSCPFTIEPQGNNAADKAAAEFVESCMHDMENTWQDTLSEILSFIKYGWSYHEIVYKRRNGKTKRRRTSSKFDDGLIGWSKLPIRSQDTLYEWKYDDYGDLEGMVQACFPDYEQVLIPIDKALHFTTRCEKANPEGKSVLRGAYRPWYYKKRIQELEGIGIERDLAGFPVLTGPEGLDLWDPNDEVALDALANATKIVTSLRRDALEGIALPNGWTLTLLASQSRRNSDTNVVIERYDKRIATTVMADFILLGQQSVGSFALSSNKTKLFSVAIGSYLDTICEVFNNQAIPALIDLNAEHFSGMTDYPKMVHADIEEPDLEKLGEFIERMISCGALFPDEGIDDYVRRVANLPERIGDYDYSVHEEENEEGSEDKDSNTHERPRSNNTKRTTDDPDDEDIEEEEPEPDDEDI